MTAFIYVMTRSDGLRQIGRTTHLSRRFYEHRSRTDRGAELELSARVPRDLASSIELETHRRIDDCRSKGEVFTCDAKTAREALFAAIVGVCRARNGDLGDEWRPRTIKEIARAFGTQQQMADAIQELGGPLRSACSRQLVEKWVKHNVIPGWWMVPVTQAGQSMGMAWLDLELLTTIAAESIMLPEGEQSSHGRPA